LFLSRLSDSFESVISGEFNLTELIQSEVREVPLNKILKPRLCIASGKIAIPQTPGGVVNSSFQALLTLRYIWAQHHSIMCFPKWATINSTFL